ncbi:SprT-like domain-containing protein [Clostridium sp.]|jgi:predicted SprT family Zn-dependent metalloprotease|uniref:SprT-like domain-containing protein n=1 Tax=Clostridium sp. TaxID=1506 RepID=UPI0039F48A2B
MEKKELIKTTYLESEIENKRHLLRNEFIYISNNINHGQIKKILVEDLQLLFNLYDKYFFNYYFNKFFKGNITFSLSKRMSRSAGKTIIPKTNPILEEEKQRYEIRIGVNFLFQYYELDREKIVAGVKTEDSLHALLMVFEHEIIHLIEFYVFGNSSCKNKRFKTIAKNIFNHKDVYHSLPTNGEIACESLGIKIGDKVSFLHEEEIKNGIVNRINKRAAIMVLDNKGNYIDGQGNRYSKYYVPLNKIRKI